MVNNNNNKGTKQMKLYLDTLMNDIYSLKLVNVTQLLKQVGLNKGKFREAVALEAEKGLKMALIMNLDKDPLVAVKLLRASFMAAASPLVDLELGLEAPNTLEKTFLFKKSTQALKPVIMADIKQIQAILETLLNIEPLLVSAETAAKANDMINQVIDEHEDVLKALSPTAQRPREAQRPRGAQRPNGLEEPNGLEKPGGPTAKRAITQPMKKPDVPQVTNFDIEAARKAADETKVLEDVGKRVMKSRLRNAKLQASSRLAVGIMKKLRGIKSFKE